jgi:hypothetical protein
VRSHLSSAALGLAALALASAASPAGAAGPSFSLAPIRLEVEATPGRPYTDALEVNNEAREPARIRVYTEDWRLERDGAVTFARAGSWPRSASTWIRINPTEIELPALATVDVRFTVSVPAGAPAGGYRAAIVVEQVPRPAPGQEAKREVAIRARIASVLYVRVGDPVPDAALHAVRYRREPNGMRSIVLDVQNKGGVHFRTAGRIALADPGTGKTVHQLTIPDVPVLPESSRDVRADVPPQVKPGTYRVRTELEVGRKEVYVFEGPLSVD